MTALRKKLGIIDDNAYDQTSPSNTCSKNQSLESYLPIEFENDALDIEVDGKQVELSLWNKSHLQDYDRSRSHSPSFSYSNENVVLMCMDTIEKMISKVEQFCLNDPIVLVETTKKDLIKMKQESVRSEEEHDMAEHIAAPVGYTFEKNHLSILPSSDHKELRMSFSGGLAFDLSSSEITHRYLCSSCKYLLVTPKCTTCHHRYCSYCLEKMIKTDLTVVCSVNGCGEVITNDKIHPDFGMARDLQDLMDIVCYNKSSGCDWRGNYISYKDHFQLCTFENLECKYCSTSATSRFLYEQHLKICPKTPVQCPLKKFGCDTQIRRESIHEHVASSLVEHILLLADVFSSFNNRLTTTDQQSLSTHSISTLIIKNADNTFLQNKSLNQDQINEEKDLQKSLRSQIKQLLKYEQDIVDQDINVEFFKDELCKLQKQYALSMFLYNDDVYLWRIDNIQQLFRDAKQASEKKSVTCSFYTHNGGYKISLKLYLNGDKTAENTHLSLYVTIMRGPCDSFLSWPFRYPILLCLYDKSSKHDHVVYTVTPDINKAFQQPRTDENDSIKISKFCPLSMIFNDEYGYIHQNKMIIKALVDNNL